MKPLLDHPLFKKLQRFDTDTEGQDPAPVPTASAHPAPPSRVPIRASTPTFNDAPPTTGTTRDPAPAAAPRRILIPYRQMNMGERGYRNEDSVTPSVTRQWTDPERSPRRDRSFWVQR